MPGIRRIMLSASILLLGCAISLGAPPQPQTDHKWTEWESVTPTLFVRFTVVQKNFEAGLPMWTWQFHNRSHYTIDFLEFRVTDDRRKRRWATDWLPGDLEPGKAFGGWAAFSTVAARQPQITTLSIKYKDGAAK